MQPNTVTEPAATTISGNNQPFRAFMSLPSFTSAAGAALAASLDRALHPRDAA
jgi:hypothetical protein